MIGGLWFRYIEASKQVNSIAFSGTSPKMFITTVTHDWLHDKPATSKTNLVYKLDSRLACDWLQVLPDKFDLQGWYPSVVFLIAL